jgi:molybdopterin converting factor subunit 1
MKIRLLLFAKLRERVGQGSIELMLPEEATVDTALDTFLKNKEDLRIMRKSLLFAVNQNYVSPEKQLQEGDELVLIPPVAGG